MKQLYLEDPDGYEICLQHPQTHWAEGYTGETRNITKLSEDELLELNRRVVERLQFIRSAKSLAQLARFSVGMAVEFDSQRSGAQSGAETRSMEAVMITLQADFNHMDAGGRLRLADLRMHQQTPFAEIAAKHETIIFLDGDDMVRGELIHDPEHGWIGQVDWSTQDVWESYPPVVAGRG